METPNIEENLFIHVDNAVSTPDKVHTVATFGADTRVNVSVCDGRPESQIDEITGNAVRLMIDSSCWDDDAGRVTRISTTTALTAKDALRLARDLIAHASNIMEG